MTLPKSNSPLETNKKTSSIGSRLAISKHGDRVIYKQKSKRKPVKSYENSEWLHSLSGRHIRIMCEFLEVQERLSKANILATVLVCGSARSLNREDWNYHMGKCQKSLEDANGLEEVEKAKEAVAKLKRIEWLCPFWDKTRELCYRLMKWFQTEEAIQAIGKLLSEIPSPACVTERPARAAGSSFTPSHASSPVALCTGGGSGMMEAANKGAADAGSPSVGMGISLPFESGLNDYVDQDLGFEFHYFFTRKFWMLYTAVGLIATPGGMGTMDELMEVLTLKQCGKFKRDIPVVLFGGQFWKSVCNFDTLVE
ncbi:lysine decarboxylase family protein, partial [Cardiosporidium cionae]